MATERIEDLSSKILLRRKKIVLVLTVIFIVLMAVNLVFIGRSLTDEGRAFQFSYLLPFFLFLGIILPMNFGVKKINEELAKRKDNQVTKKTPTG
jgi:uncharacterized membrane protein